jgi:hypothetical protein
VAFHGDLSEEAPHGDFVERRSAGKDDAHLDVVRQGRGILRQRDRHPLVWIAGISEFLTGDLELVVLVILRGRVRFPSGSDEWVSLDCPLQDSKIVNGHRSHRTVCANVCSFTSKSGKFSLFGIVAIGDRLIKFLLRLWVRCVQWQAACR